MNEADDTNGRLTIDRVMGVLARREWSYAIDLEGDPEGIWDGNRFQFYAAGDADEVLVVLGTWHRRPVGTATHGAILEVLNEWHAGHFWPKAYAVVDEDGGSRVMCEMAVDLEHGVTDIQLDHYVCRSLITSLELFSHLDATFIDRPVADPVAE